MKFIMCTVVLILSTILFSCSHMGITTQDDRKPNQVTGDVGKDFQVLDESNPQSTQLKSISCFDRYNSYTVGFHTVFAPGSKVELKANIVKFSKRSDDSAYIVYEVDDAYSNVENIFDTNKKAQSYLLKNKIVLKSKDEEVLKLDFSKKQLFVNSSKKAFKCK